jgi:hypothetical protein
MRLAYFSTFHFVLYPIMPNPYDEAHGDVSRKIPFFIVVFSHIKTKVAMSPAQIPFLSVFPTHMSFIRETGVGAFCFPWNFPWFTEFEVDPSLDAFLWEYRWEICREFFCWVLCVF